MINSVTLVGRMAGDAELRYTPSNQSVATFRLAVNRNFKSQNGEREADFINCVIWRQQAENLANWAKKRSFDWYHWTYPDTKLRKPARSARICDRGCSG